jgi:hypothetical protein
MIQSNHFADDRIDLVMETTYARFQHLEADMWVSTDE